MIRQRDTTVRSLDDLTEATFQRIHEVFQQEATRCLADGAGLWHAGLAALDRIRAEACTAGWHPINVEHLAHIAGVRIGDIITDMGRRS